MQRIGGDEDEYCACSGCIDDFRRLTRIPFKYWKKYYSRTAIWKSGPERDWCRALLQSKHLMLQTEQNQSSQTKRAAKKRKSKDCVSKETKSKQKHKQTKTSSNESEDTDAEAGFIPNDTLSLSQRMDVCVQRIQENVQELARLARMWRALAATHATEPP